jgi:alpha-D-ribose 1-methylphosphonate 5-triphosphate synthase subunit PhnH
MASEALAIEGGFADPLLGSQSVFRALMDALAQPGVVRPISVFVQPPSPLTIELAAVALTLADHDSPVWLDARLRNTGPVLDWLRFHTGAPLDTDPASAAFAFADGAQVLPQLSDFAQGTDEYPDRSTTLVIEVEGFQGGARLTLRGPGIKDETSIAPSGLPQGFVSQWNENRALFPRGIDVVLVAAGHVLGIPRTTRISTELP